MKSNVGRGDRLVRLVLGVATLVAGILDLFPDTLLNQISIGAGIVLLATAALSFCPIYRFLGIRSDNSDKAMY